AGKGSGEQVRPGAEETNRDSIALDHRHRAGPVAYVERPVLVVAGQRHRIAGEQLGLLPEASTGRRGLELQPADPHAARRIAAMEPGTRPLLHPVKRPGNPRAQPRGNVAWGERLGPRCDGNEGEHRQHDAKTHASTPPDGGTQRAPDGIQRLTGPQGNPGPENDLPVLSAPYAARSARLAESVGQRSAANWDRRLAQAEAAPSKRGRWTIKSPDQFGSTSAFLVQPTLFASPQARTVEGPSASARSVSPIGRPPRDSWASERHAPRVSPPETSGALRRSTPMRMTGPRGLRPGRKGRKRAADSTGGRSPAGARRVADLRHPSGLCKPPSSDPA